MTPGLIMMWISFVSLILMFLSVGGILLSRYKLKNVFLKTTISTISFFMMVIAGILMVFVVFSGPSNG